MKAQSLVLLALFLGLFAQVSAQEICANAIDDDMDGLIDLNDTLDCNCDQLTSGSGGIPSIIPNPSFEDNTCCPSSWSMLNCADTWVQATNPTTDYMHTCDFYPFPGLAPPPDGDGIVGAFILDGWMEFVGGCLLSPMTTGTQYTLAFWLAAEGTNGTFSMTCPFSIPIDVTLYGYTSCPTFPVGTSGCPVPNGWIELGSVNYTPNNQWQQVIIDFVPTSDVEAVMIGGPCTLPVGYPSNSSQTCYPYFMYDDLTLNESTFFNANLDVDGHWCTNDLVLTAHPDTLGTYQWFRDGIALIGETDTILDVSSGGYMSGEFAFQLNFGVDSCALATVNVPPPVYPTVDFTGSNLVGCAPLVVDFTNLTDPLLTANCIWDFGDGTMGYSCDTTYTYTTPGTYDVNLTVISPDGCEHDTTFSDYVLVSDFADITFIADEYSGCAAHTVNFTNTIDPNLVGTCDWDFGDGNGSIDCNPTHNYSTPGVYDVSLTITSPGGCVSDSTYSQLITVYENPVVSFNVDDSDGCYPHLASFTNTTDSVFIGSCYWEFGNGQTSTDCNPDQLYGLPGFYDVSLTVTSPNGCIDSLIVPGMIEAFDFPLVTFTLDDSSGCWPHTVQFTNLTDPAFTDQCLWDFGDGGSTNDCSPSYTYLTPGIFDVQLEVTSADGCSSDTVYNQLIEVFDHPIAGFDFSPTSTDLYDTEIFFEDQSSADVVSWYWDFAGQGADSVPSPVFVFNDQLPGQHTVTLTSTNSNGCQDSYSAVVIIDGLFNLYVPNSFTPDGDGLNEGFKPIGEGIDPNGYEFSVFDRWGERIFDTKDPSHVWDGTYKGELCQTGVYAWRLVVAALYTDEVKEYFGSVTLLR